MNNHLNENQIQIATYEHFIDLQIQDIVGFKLSNDSNYIAQITQIKSQSNYNQELLQVSIYQTKSFQCMITLNIQQINQNSDTIFFSDNSSYFCYYTHVQHLNLLNLQNLTFLIIPISFESHLSDHYFLQNTLFIKQNLLLHLYNIQNQSKIEKVRFGYPFSQFTPISENQYLIINDTKVTLELWSNYKTYFKIKLSKQLSTIPDRLLLLQTNIILCVFLQQSIQFLSKNNFTVLRTIMFQYYFTNTQLHLTDQVSLIRTQQNPSKLEHIQFLPEICQNQLSLEQDIFDQFNTIIQTSKLLIGFIYQNYDNFIIKIYKINI